MSANWWHNTFVQALRRHVEVADGATILVVTPRAAELGRTVAEDCSRLGVKVVEIKEALAQAAQRSVGLVVLLAADAADQRVADTELAPCKQKGVPVALLSHPQRLSDSPPSWQQSGISYAGMWFLAAQYIRSIRPQGAYVEFGVYDGHTFTLAWQALRNVVKEFYAFDSFAGIGGAKESEATHFADGQYFANLETFQHSMRYTGADPDRVHAVEGFFSDTLTGKRPSDYGIYSASMVHIDTDVYAPAFEALKFIEPVLPQGALLLFDDYDQMASSNKKGERRAINEWLSDGEGAYSLEPYRSYGTFCRSFVFHRH